MTKGLDQYASSVYSQNGEDGILRHIFEEIGYESRQFLEFGYSKPECNAWNLMMNEDFGGVFIDAKAEEKEVIVGVQSIKAHLTTDNINGIVARASMAGIDLLSIDVDGNDYWLWEALACVSPRVVVIEYNASLGPTASKTIVYDPDFHQHGPGIAWTYFGASITALERLGWRKGYHLIGCDPEGINAFFLHKDIVGLDTLTAEEAWRPWKYCTVEEAAKWTAGMTWVEIT